MPPTRDFKPTMAALCHTVSYRTRSAFCIGELRTTTRSSANGRETVAFSPATGQRTSTLSAARHSSLEASRNVCIAQWITAAGIPAGTERILARTRNSGWSTADTEFRSDYVAFDEGESEGYMLGMTYYLPSKKRWAVRYPKLHHIRGNDKDSDARTQPSSSRKPSIVGPASGEMRNVRGRP